MKQLLESALVLAAGEGFDVFNSLDLLDFDEKILTDLRFGRGDGKYVNITTTRNKKHRHSQFFLYYCYSLHYYVYNYRCTTLPPGQVGLILL
jgi:hypothetical protein